MSGRNGIDKLSYGLLAVYCILAAVKLPFKTVPAVWIIISIIQYAVCGYIVFRILSRNVQKRYNENFAFEKFLNAWKPYFSVLIMRIKYIRTHRFRKCKNCGNLLRLKKSRGKRTVICPKCGSELNLYFLF